MFCYRLLFRILPILLFGLATICQGADSHPVFRAGTAISDITPTEFPVALVGGFHPRMTSEVADPLHARALVLDDGTDRFAFLVIDNCLMPVELHEKIKAIASAKTGLAVDRICISTTHNHTSPPLTSVHAVDPDERYIKTLPDRAAEALVLAVKNLQPVQVGYGRIKEPRHVFCRRFLMKPGTALDIPSAFTGVKQNVAQMNPGRLNPNAITRTGIADQNLYVLALRTLDGKPVGMLANYSTHYAQDGGKISADYFAVFADKVAELLHAPKSFTAIMTNGTSGDNNCIDFLKKEEDQKYDKYIVANHLAEDALTLWKQIEFRNWVPLAAEESILTVKIRKASKEDIAEAQTHLEKLKKAGKPIQSIVDVYAHRTVIDADLPAERKVKVQAIRIGELGIVTLPSEVYNWTGHNIRAYSPFDPTFVISLANGYNGYLPTVDSFELGGYTTWRTPSSILERNAEPILREELLVLLKKLQNKK